MDGEITGSQHADIRSVCVFCGSSAGKLPAYREAAETMGKEIARRGLRLVYGSGSVGLMGAIATAARDGGAKVLGIIPYALEGVEISGKGVGDVKMVHSMHERKAEMSKEADAFIAMPGRQTLRNSRHLVWVIHLDAGMVGYRAFFLLSGIPQWLGSYWPTCVVEECD